MEKVDYFVLLSFPMFEQNVLIECKVKYGKHGGLIASALDSGSGGLGLSPGRGTALCSWARYFTLIVPLSTQVYLNGYRQIYFWE